MFYYNNTYNNGWDDDAFKLTKSYKYDDVWHKKDLYIFKN